MAEWTDNWTGFRIRYQPTGPGRRERLVERPHGCGRRNLTQDEQSWNHEVDLQRRADTAGMSTRVIPSAAAKSRGRPSRKLLASRPAAVRDGPSASPAAFLPPTGDREPALRDGTAVPRASSWANGDVRGSNFAKTGMSGPPPIVPLLTLLQSSLRERWPTRRFLVGATMRGVTAVPPIESLCQNGYVRTPPIFFTDARDAS